MRQRVPLLLCFLCGIVMIVQFFVPHHFSQVVYKRALDWMLVVGVFALVLGVGSLMHVHYTKIARRTENWPYSILVFVGLIVMSLAGLIKGIQGTLFLWIYGNIQVPLEATMFSLLAFFIASAAYRAFRARTLEATLLLIAGILVMFGNVPIGNAIWASMTSWFPALPSAIKDWILENPNLAARRAIFLGIGLGGISQGLRIILGIERSHFGGGE